MGKERGRKRGERMKGRGSVGVGRRKERGGTGRKDGKIKWPTKKEALSRSGDLGKEGRKWNGRKEE